MLGAEPIDTSGPEVDGDLLAMAWHHAHDAMAVVRGDGVIIRSNDAFDRFVQRPAENLHLDDILAPADIGKALQTCDPTQRVPVAGLDPSGYPFLAELTASRGSGEFAFVTLRERRPFMAHRPPPLDDAHEAIAHALSHDVRGRVRGVAGFLRLVDEELDAGRVGDARQLLDRAAASERAADLMLERLVRYQRLGDTTFDLVPEPLDALVADAASAEDCVVRIDRLPIVLADRPLLVEALAELLRNARQWASTATTNAVTVSATRSPRWCEVRIADSGSGIAPEFVDECFGLFRQLQARDWARGVGMGLPIARRIVDGHGGCISIGTNGDAGTAVTIRLAVAPDH